MGLLKKLFGKKSPSKKTSTKSTAPPKAAGTSITADSSPKEAVNYIFQQMATGTTRDDLLDDLAQRGFHKKTAEEYIDLVNKTMFKGR